MYSRLDSLTMTSKHFTNHHKSAMLVNADTLQVITRTPAVVLCPLCSQQRTSCAFDLTQVLSNNTRDAVPNLLYIAIGWKIDILRPSIVLPEHRDGLIGLEHQSL